MTLSLFVYGTLLSPKVLKRITGKTFVSTAATLFEYARYPVQGEVYPALLPQKEESVEGLMLSGLFPQDLKLLDAFEGDEYERKEVLVTLKTGETMSAITYVWKKSPSRLDTPEEWSLEEYERDQGV